MNKIGEMMEGAYWNRVVSLLRANSNQSLFVVSSVATGRFGSYPQDGLAASTLIELSEESGRFPDRETSLFRHVFKAYLRGAHGNADPIPPGATIAWNPNRDVLASSERPLNVLFRGNLNAQRADLWMALAMGTAALRKPLPRVLRRALVLAVRRLGFPKDFSSRYPDSQLVFTTQFASGLSHTDYASELETAKIVICPPGFCSPETFRHFDAARCGAVVVTMPLPRENWYYENCPFVEMASWADLDQTLKSLLSEPTKMADLQMSTLRWFEEKASESAVAQFILNRI